MIILTKEQASLMSHCISGNNRNWFGTSSTSPDGQQWEALVLIGLATKQPGPFSNETVYCLTPEGRKALEHFEGTGK